jgi:hypothetical protein
MTIVQTVCLQSAISECQPADLVIARLAVRTSGFTRIYRAIARLKGASSRLSLQPLVTHIPFGSDGTVEHADVAFNPWYDKQFGIIDHQGDWRVLDLEGSYEASRKNFGMKLNCVAEGRMITGDEQKGNGWGRITWGGDLNTVMTCDRHTAALFDIRVIFYQSTACLDPADQVRPTLRPPALLYPSIETAAGSLTFREGRL